MFFIFVNYKKTDKEIEIIKESIETQGWEVIQMSKPLEINEKQDLKGFFRGMKNAYEIYIGKETKKIAEIKKMIKDF